MNKVKKVIIVLILICILFPKNVNAAMNLDLARKTLSEFAINFEKNYAEQTGYSCEDNIFDNQASDRAMAWKGIKQCKGNSDKYGMDCVGWVCCAIHWSLKLGDNDSFVDLANFWNKNFLERIENPSELYPGDIIDLADKEHVGIYAIDPETDEKVFIHCSGGGRNGAGVQRSNFDEYFNTHSIQAVYRLTENAAQSINPNNVTTMFNDITGAADDYDLYYGTTQGHYAGSYTLGEWLFNKFAGFFDYLAGIITYIFRAQFLGWGNIIEELVNLAINKATGIETVTVEKNEENSEENSGEESTSTTGTGNLYTPSATNTMWSTNRINIEDIIYNRVPLLDINFLDVKLDRYREIENVRKSQASEGEEIQVISEDSIVYTLRANIAKWYIVIRQICIIVLLLLLIYLGIRLAISTVASDKAKYKGMLVAWLTSFIVVFCIHYYMMIVIEVNEVFVDIFAEVSQNAIEKSDNGTGSQSIYDTIRTRAYSLKLSEGFPATIFYMVLIYFLIRFLFIYIKRYFTIMILAVMGPIMTLKNCFDKISTGKSKSMSKWMYNFALNVFLQTIHAILYCLFMVIAFDLATNSVAGFVMALIVLNFIFKAEKIFMNIFNFEERASSLRDVNENKNYFAEAYKIGMGMTMFGGTALKYGFGAVAGSGKFLGEKALSSVQIGTSAFSRLVWGMRSIGARISGGDSIDYVPIDLREKFNNGKENAKNGMADRFNSVIEGITGKRSLRLDLHNIKSQDPVLYEKAKEALRLKKDLKWKTLKRTFGDSAKSIRYMAELMMGVPMLVVDTQSGISALVDATSGLRGRGVKKKEYGYKAKIKGKKGNLATAALNAATFGGVNATANNIKQFKKDHKKIVNNNKLVGNLNKANMLEIKIQKEVDKMIIDGKKKDEVEKIMDNALKEVMTASKIREAVSRYMVMKGIKNVTESDLSEIVDKINSEVYGGNVDKIIDKFMKNGSKDKLEASDIDKILQIIDDKVETGVLAVINDKTNKEDKHTKVKSNVKKFMKKEGVKAIDADKAKELLKSEDAESSFGIETTQNVKDSIARKFGGKKTKVLDKKQAVNAIEDAILAGAKEKETDLGRMMRELKTHREKTKNTRGKTVVDISEFTKGLKEKLK